MNLFENIDPAKAAEYGITFYVIAIFAVIMITFAVLYSKYLDKKSQVSNAPALRCSDVLAVAINNNTTAMEEVCRTSKELHLLISTSMSTQNAKMDELLAHARGGAK